MALNFPDSPFVGQIYSDVTAGFSYVWDGTVWKSYYQSDQTPDGTVTPPKLSPGGPVWNTSGDLNVTGILTAANISVAGTITYEDVTSVDSIGVVTARSGVVVVGGGVSVAGGGIDVNGHTETDTLRVSGVSTFSSTINANGNIINLNNSITNVRFADSLGFFDSNDDGYLILEGSSVRLAYADGTRLQTIGTGVTVTGTTFTNQLSVSGVVTAASFSGSGSNLTGIVTSITAGSGISIDQSTGNVTITSTGGGETISPFLLIGA